MLAFAEDKEFISFVKMLSHVQTLLVTADNVPSIEEGDDYGLSGIQFCTEEDLESFSTEIEKKREEINQELEMRAIWMDKGIEIQNKINKIAEKLGGDHKTLLHKRRESVKKQMLLEEEKYNREMERKTLEFQRRKKMLLELISEDVVEKIPTPKTTSYINYKQSSLKNVDEFHLDHTSDFEKEINECGDSSDIIHTSFDENKQERNEGNSIESKQQRENNESNVKEKEDTSKDEHFNEHSKRIQEQKKEVSSIEKIQKNEDGISDSEQQFINDKLESTMIYDFTQELQRSVIDEPTTITLISKDRQMKNSNLNDELTAFQITKDEQKGIETKSCEEIQEVGTDVNTIINKQKESITLEINNHKANGIKEEKGDGCDNDNSDDIKEVVNDDEKKNAIEKKCYNNAEDEKKIHEFFKNWTGKNDYNVLFDTDIHGDGKEDVATVIQSTQQLFIVVFDKSGSAFGGFIKKKSRKYNGSEYDTELFSLYYSNHLILLKYNISRGEENSSFNLLPSSNCLFRFGYGDLAVSSISSPTSMTYPFCFTYPSNFQGLTPEAETNTHQFTVERFIIFELE
ncbi:hypothetical protein QTN25_009845 [Entamoeba marina]